MRIEDAKGDWALVSGASSGIGREFCVQLAAAGMNVVMVARRKQVMDELASNLRAQHGIRTLVIDQDLSLPGAAASVRKRVAEQHVSIRLLINNAGFGPWGQFENTSAEVYERLVHLVSATPVSMCRLFLPDLASFKTSAIVNLSSPAALQPIPYMAVYAAAKSCLHNFSLALFGEWKDRGVHVQTLIPGPTESEFDAKAGAYSSALKEQRGPASRVVNASLSALGKGAAVVTTASGVYKQRVFAGVFPYESVIRTVGGMFRPPTDTSG